MGEKPPDIIGQGNNATIKQAPTVISFPPSQQFPEEFLVLELLTIRSIAFSLIVIILSPVSLASNFALVPPMHYSTTYPHWNPTTIITSSNRSTAYRSFIVIIFTTASNSTTTLTTTTSTSTSVHHFLVSFKAPPSFTGLENVGHLYYNHIKITIKYNVSPNEKNSISIGCIQALLISIIIP